MKAEEAARRAMVMEPGRPGVGRLCQELLVDAYGLALSREPFAQRALDRVG